MPSNLMRNLISIKRPAFGQDASFGITAPLTTVYSNIGASVQPAHSSIQFLYQQRNVKVTHSIYTDRKIEIENGDIVTLADGTNYLVEGFRDLILLSRVLAIDVVLYLN